MNTIIEILKLAAQFKQGFPIRVINPPWKDLLIEDLHRRGPKGWPAFAVAERGEEDELFPQMLFEIARAEQQFTMVPLSLRRNLHSEVEECAMENHGCWIIQNSLQKRQGKFAKSWDKQLAKHGYLDAYRLMLKEHPSE